MSTVNGFQVGSETLKYNYESLDNYNTPNFSTSPSETYAVGDYVMYNGKLYKCTMATTGGTWVSSNWTEAVLSDDVRDLNRHLNDKQDAPSASGTAGQVLGLDSNLDPVWVNQSGGSGLTNDIKSALLQLASKVAYIDSGGQTYYDDLFDALYPDVSYWTVTNSLINCSTDNSALTVIDGTPYSAIITAESGYSMDGATVSVVMGETDITSTAYSNGVVSIASVSGNLSITVSAAESGLQSISAVFTQGQNVYYDFDYLDSLKEHLVVTGNYGESDQRTIPATDYLLSGTLVAGTTSTITVTYGGETDTFTVSVSALPSLPSGYTAYDYILNTIVGGTGPANNGICIDTGLNAQTYATSSYSRRIDFEHYGSESTTTSSPLYGCRGGTTPSYVPSACGLFIRQSTDSQGDMFAVCQWNGVQTDIGYFDYNTPQVIEMKGSSIYKDGVLIADNVGDPTEYEPIDLNIALFGELRNNYYAVKSMVKIKRFIVRDSYGEAVAAMLPCADSNDSAGLYDVVREVFKQAKTPSTLIVGNDS